MTHRKLTRIGALTVALVLAGTACEDSFTGSEVGQVTILLTDAPEDFHAAVVTIDGIYLQGSANEDAGRFWLRTDPVTTDLLTLSNDVMELVENVEVPSGTYAQLRFIISGAYIEVEGEEGETLIYASSSEYSEEHHPDNRARDGTLQMPGFEQTGLKVVLPDGALHVGTGQVILLADFNVAESFGQLAGESGMWVMDPVVHAVDFGFSSSVTVTLSLDEGIELPEGQSLEDFAARLENGGETKDDGFVENEGAFTASFPYLFPGQTWELSLLAPDDLQVETEPALPIAVETVSGAGVEVELLIVGVSDGD